MNFDVDLMDPFLNYLFCSMRMFPLLALENTKDVDVSLFLSFMGIPSLESKSLDSHSRCRFLKSFRRKMGSNLGFSVSI